MGLWVTYVCDVCGYSRRRLFLRLKIVYKRTDDGSKQPKSTGGLCPHCQRAFKTCQLDTERTKEIGNRRGIIERVGTQKLRKIGPIVYYMHWWCSPLLWICRSLTRTRDIHYIIFRSVRSPYRWRGTAAQPFSESEKNICRIIPTADI